jgi:hypothetical protein
MGEMKLYVAIDLFHAGAYRAPDGLAGTEDYSHDRNFYYAVLQPLLIRGGGGVGVEESPSLPEYLGWSVADLNQLGRVALAGKDLAAMLRGVPSPVSVTPVPFPPDAAMSFKVRWENAGTVVGRSELARDLSQPGPFRLAANLWPEFAARNSMSRAIRTWEHLSSAQVRQLFDWAYGLMQTLRKSPVSVLEQGILDTFFAPGVTADNSRKHWEDFLLPGNPSPLRKLMELLWNTKDYANEPRLQPPSFRYSPDEIRAHGAALFPSPAASYHQQLWQQLKEFLNGAGLDGEKQAVEALGRLYGFGERLRWPKPAQNPIQDFMVVLPKDESTTDPWLVTNVHSLAGQVFRIGPIPAGTAIDHFEVEELTVGANPLFLNEPAEDPFEERLLAFRREAARLAAADRRFSVGALRDPKFPAGRVWFLPRNARAQSTGLVLEGTNDTVFAVPGSLLDALDATARFEAPPTGKALTRLNPQRFLLNPGELADGTFPGKRYVRFKMRVREVSLSKPAPGGHVYELTLSGAYQPEELGTLRRYLGTKDEVSKAELWVEQAAVGSTVARRFPLLDQFLGFEIRGEDPDTKDAVTVLTVSDPQGKLHDLLPKTPEQEAPPKSKQDPVIDFVRPVNAGERFNVLAGTDPQGPMMVLAHHFDYRVSRSAERLLERFGLTYNPVPPKSVPFADDSSPADPIVGHFANFNKLRAALHGPGGREIQLHFPAALAPLPPQGAGQPDEPSRNAIPDPGAPLQSYWLAHQFSEEIQGEADDSEESHYAAFVTAGEPWALVGTAEHQYSHKVPLDGRLSLAFPLSTDVRNLAALSLPVAVSGAQPQPKPALTYDHRPGSPEAIVIRLEPSYVLEALARSDAGGPARLRALYEALSDFATGNVTLRLERWNFDNTINPPRPLAVADPDTAVEFPGVATHLRFDGAATHVLTTAEKAPFAQLLGATFADFVQRLKAVTTRLPLPSLPLAGAVWSWDAGKRPAGDSLTATTNVIRLGLQVDRPSTRAIGTEVAATADSFVPLEPNKGMSGQADPDADFIFSKASTARQEARDELHAALESLDSPVRHSFAWIASDDEDYQASLAARDGIKGFDRDRGRKLFGESYPYLNFPTGLAAKEPRVADLFYVPWAFRPLKTHPELGDPRTTLEYAEYLTSILAGIARGRALDEVDVNPEDAASAWVQRNEARKAVADPGGIADLLTALLDRVEGTPTAAAEDELFRSVRKLADDVDTERRKVMRELLTADPTLFATAKAIAVGVFDPGSYSDRLYTLEVTKTIRDAPAGELPDKDADRFPFSRLFGRGNQRFLVDVLDDKSYDNDFEIAENVYDAAKPPGTPRQAAEISKRGAARARTGEDLVEQAFFFAEDPVRPAMRSLEANVVHYNPQWVEKDKAGNVLRRRYLLPSRSFPRVPKPMQPIDDGTGQTRLARLLPVFPDAGPVNLDGQFAARLAAAMPEKVHLKQGKIAAQGSLVATPEPGRRAAVGASDAPGWHHLDSYLSHYYFLVEADEEGDFGTDVFEIYVERGPAPFASETTPAVSEPKFNQGLKQWFLYHCRRDEGDGSRDNPVQKPTAPMALKDVVTEARMSLPALLVPAVPAESRDTTATFSLKGLAGWELEPGKAAPAGGVGRVLAAELMRIQAVDGAEPLDDGKRLLHIAVLDDVWQYQRVRVRVLRNGEDANDDKVLDVNPAFLMSSDASDWVDYGRDVLRLRGGAEGDLPAAIAFLQAGISRAAWLGNGTAKPGPLIRAVLEKTFPVTGGGPAATAGFWNAGELKSAERKVNGVVIQTLPDLHPRQAKDGPGKPIAERYDELSRQLLLEVAASDLDTFGELRQEVVRTVSPGVRITWMNAQRVPLLEVTWPVRWLPVS